MEHRGAATRSILLLVMLGLAALTACRDAAPDVLGRVDGVNYEIRSVAANDEVRVVAADIERVHGSDREPVRLLVPDSLGPVRLFHVLNAELTPNARAENELDWLPHTLVECRVGYLNGNLVVTAASKASTSSLAAEPAPIMGWGLSDVETARGKSLFTAANNRDADSSAWIEIDASSGVMRGVMGTSMIEHALYADMHCAESSVMIESGPVADWTVEVPIFIDNATALELDGVESPLLGYEGSSGSLILGRRVTVEFEVRNDRTFATRITVDKEL